MMFVYYNIFKIKITTAETWWQIIKLFFCQLAPNMFSLYHTETESFRRLILEIKTNKNLKQNYAYHYNSPSHCRPVWLFLVHLRKNRQKIKNL